MKKITLLATLLILSSCVFAQDINFVAAQYIKYYSSGELEKASKLMACPESYSEQQLINERKANLQSLKIFEKEFGQVTKAESAKSNLYITVMTACGDMMFLNENAPFINVVFDVTYDNKTKGYIVLGFSSTSNYTKLVTVNHGLPALELGAKEKVSNVLYKLSTK